MRRHKAKCRLHRELADGRRAVFCRGIGIASRCYTQRNTSFGCVGSVMRL